MDVMAEQTQSIKSLKEQRDKYAAYVSKLDEAIKILEGNQEKPVDWKNKALQCLRRQDKFLRTVQILDCMFYDEPEKLQDDRKRKNYTNALSLALNNLCEDNVLGRVSFRGKKGFYYGLKNWFKESGEIVLDYSNKLDDEIWN